MYTIKEIVGFIEGEPEIGTEKVTAEAEKVTGLTTEEGEPGEGVISYEFDSLHIIR